MNPFFIHISMALTFALLGFLFAWKYPAIRIATMNWFHTIEGLWLKRLFASLVNTPLRILAGLTREMLALCRGAAARMGGGCRPPVQWVGGVLVFLLTLASAMPARAIPQSFNFTNIIQSALTVTSWPTNAPTTNYWSAGVLPGQTNQYLLNWQTGKGVEIKNYDSADFVVSANITSSNLAALTFFVVKASGISGNGSPLVLINTNNSTILYNDWETATPAYDIIQVPIPAGTNYAFNWRTNFPVGNADFIGIYQETNNISFGAAGQVSGWASNLVVALDKKIKPIRFP